MLEILKFIFSDFWIFLGFLIILSAFTDTVLSMWKSLLEYRLRKIKEAYSINIEVGKDFKNFLEDDK